MDVDNLITVICSKKLKLDPENKKAIFIRASSYLKKNMYKLAIEDCNALIELDSENAGAYYVRGCCYEKIGNLD